MAAPCRQRRRRHSLFTRSFQDQRVELSVRFMWRRNVDIPTSLRLIWGAHRPTSRYAKEELALLTRRRLTVCPLEFPSSTFTQSAPEVAPSPPWMPAAL